MHGLLQSPCSQYSHAGPFFWSQKRSLVMIFSPPTYELVTQKQSYCQGLTRLRHWASKFNKWQVQNPGGWGGGSLSLSWICLATKAGGLFESDFWGQKCSWKRLMWCDQILNAVPLWDKLQCTVEEWVSKIERDRVQPFYCDPMRGWWRHGAEILWCVLRLPQAHHPDPAQL